MKNMNSIKCRYNRNMLNPKQTSFGCNCRKEDKCPLNGKCLTPKVVYRADVTNKTNNGQKKFFGLAETTFKERCNNHKWEVKHIKCQNNTELTKYIWNLKNNNIKYTIKWKIIYKVYGNANLAMCKLRLMEKLWIINHITDTNILDKKSELINKCRHLNKLLLKRYQENSHPENPHLENSHQWTSSWWISARKITPRKFPPGIFPPSFF